MEQLTKEELQDLLNCCNLAINDTEGTLKNCNYIHGWVVEKWKLTEAIERYYKLANKLTKIIDTVSGVKNE